MTEPNKKTTDEWLQDLENPKKGHDWVLPHRPTLEPGAQLKLDNAINNYKQKQKDIAHNDLMDQNEKSLKIQSEGNELQWAIFLCMLIGLVVTILVAFD